MIHGCQFKGLNLKFHRLGEDPQASASMNMFTILVGKNGVGKSLLLRDLVKTFVPLQERERERFISRYEKRHEFTGDVEYSHYPAKIIASSTSPFDKFPIDRYGDYESVYEYLGLKGLPSHNLSLGFLGRTIGALIKALQSNRDHLTPILRVFRYLDYLPYLKARMVLVLQPRKIREILGAEDPISNLGDYLAKRGGSPSSVDGVYRSPLPHAYARDLLRALEFFISVKHKPRIDIVIDQDGAFDGETRAPLSSAYSLLLDSGLLRIRDVSLRKNYHLADIQISDASSGEQCVLMALLGIASHIQDYSLICIDEPEICLHPEWQERYIELLIDSFSSFQGCHFIIATHSPQIVSNLANHNCYVLDMQKGETVSAAEVNRKSADFQLASVFGAPGFKNEYLSREIISALGSLGAGESLSSDRVSMLRDIIQLQDAISPDDPVYRLISMLSTALEEY